MKKQLITLWREYRGFILFLFLMFCFRSTFADWNDVPTGSMKPTIVEGDRIFVNKMAYDIRVPFTHISLIKRGDPERGDIIVFDSAVSEKRLVKRVVGVPGDKVAMQNNTLYINGQVLSYDDATASEGYVDMEENLLGIEHKIRVENRFSELSSFPEIVIPESHFLALGDNRDNSADSRVIGFVPREEIVGRSRSVVLSLNYDNYFLPRTDRFFEPLH